MLRIIAFFIVLLAAALGLGWLADRPGEVMLTWQGQRYEVTLMTALGGVFLLGVAMIFFWSLFRIVLRLPSIVALTGHARRRTRGFSAVSRGMVAIGAGDARAAQRSASEAKRLLGEEPMTLLLSAQAAQLSGDRPAAEAAFSRMLDRDETRVLGLRGLFLEARRKGDAAASRFYADEAFKLAPGVAWVNDAALDYRMREGDWNGAATVVEQSVSRRLLDRPTGRRQRAALLAAAALQQRGQDPDGALAKAQAALRLNPGLVPAAVLAGRRLTERGESSKAGKLLEVAWKQGTHPDIADAYLDVRAGDSALDRLTRARSLMKLAPGDQESGLTVARAAIDAREFTAARAALEPLANAHPTGRACLLMAEIEEKSGGSTGAVREWLARASRAAPDRAWVSPDGAVQDVWSPYSPVSGAVDAFEWREPPRSAEMIGQRGYDAPTMVDHHVDAPPATVIEHAVVEQEAPAPAMPEPAPSQNATPAAAPVIVEPPSAKLPDPANDSTAPALPRSPDDPGIDETAENTPRKGAFRLFSS